MDYQRFVDAALKLINDKGRSITIRTDSEGAYDQITGTFSDFSNSSVTVKGVFTSYKLDEVDGTLIQRGDKQVLVAGNITIPDSTDALIDDSVEYQIVDVQTVQPGDTVLLYKIQVRR